MNIYELEAGSIRKFVVAKDEVDARNQGSDPVKHPDLHFRAFTVTSVHVEGYTINATPNEPKKANKADKVKIEKMDRDQLKEWLTDKGIEFTPQSGEAKLRELALANV